MLVYKFTTACSIVGALSFARMLLLHPSRLPAGDVCLLLLSLSIASDTTKWQQHSLYPIQTQKQKADITSRQLGGMEAQADKQHINDHHSSFEPS